MEDLRQMIVDRAKDLGMSPRTLAAIISYETGGTFDPMQRGPTTKWGQHIGLIQFGEPQRGEYGVDLSSPEAALASQLGPGGAVVKYFQDRGWKPGMSDVDAYSIVNAGAPGLHGASDAAAGGAPGTVRDKVETQFGPHYARAEKMLGGSGGGGADRDPQRLAWAYGSGKMTPGDAKIYEDAMMRGVVPVASKVNPLDIYRRVAMGMERG